MLTEFQNALGAWVLDGSPLPPELDGLRRLALYRNNVQGSLTAVLAAAYPTVEQVVGPEFFAMVARRFLGAYPPLRPELWAWGGEFSAFLAVFPPARALSYLPDLARLEWAMMEAYFAGEAEALKPERLRSVTTHAMGLSFSRHPSARIIRSRFAIHSIWKAHVPGGDPSAVSITMPESVLILRQDGVVMSRLLSDWQASFAETLLDGLTFGAALIAVPDHVSPADIPVELARLIADGVFTGYAADMPSTLSAWIQP
ncbi:DUF2063 domain-containing protein [Lacibacterium aquatile]|uniref:DUF2063 domain-containing protein n=1 Tax=Lacibacterium aquatile TaxID=1168082 RepID=A0ABW5DKQ5_9PROT